MTPYRRRMDARAVAAFAAPDVGCVGGACRPVSRPRARAGCPSACCSSRASPGGARTRASRARVPSGRSARTWPSARMRSPRSAGSAEELGRHGTSLLSGEDSDMVRRVLDAGRGCGSSPPPPLPYRACRAPRVPLLVAPAVVGGHQPCGQPEPGLTRPAARRGARATRSVGDRRDRVYLYRLAETAGYLAAGLRIAGGAG